MARKRMKFERAARVKSAESTHRVPDDHDGDDPATRSSSEFESFDPFESSDTSAPSIDDSGLIDSEGDSYGDDDRWSADVAINDLFIEPINDVLGDAVWHGPAGDAAFDTTDDTAHHDVIEVEEYTADAGTNITWDGSLAGATAEVAAESTELPTEEIVANPTDETVAPTTDETDYVPLQAPSRAAARARRLARLASEGSVNWGALDGSAQQDPIRSDARDDLSPPTEAGESTNTASIEVAAIEVWSSEAWSLPTDDGQADLSIAGELIPQISDEFDSTSWFDAPSDGWTGVDSVARTDDIGEPAVSTEATPTQEPETGLDWSAEADAGNEWPNPDMDRLPVPAHRVVMSETRISLDDASLDAQTASLLRDAYRLAFRLTGTARMASNIAMAAAQSATANPDPRTHLNLMATHALKLCLGVSSETPVDQSRVITHWEHRTRLRRELCRYSQHERTILALRHLIGLAPGTVAKVVGTDEESVRNVTARWVPSDAPSGDSLLVGLDNWINAEEAAATSSLPSAPPGSELAALDDPFPPQFPRSELTALSAGPSTGSTRTPMRQLIRR